jgi:hypothetical protein
MNKDLEKKLYSRFIKAANEISKNEKEPASWIVFDVPKKFGVLKVKEWLKEKRKPKAYYTKELVDDLKEVHGLDAELELTRILTNEIKKAVENEKRKKDI